MAAIQFIGMPEITKEAVVQYGFIPKIEGGNEWYVQVIHRIGGEKVVAAMPDRKSAKYLADVLVDYYKGG